MNTLHALAVILNIADPQTDIQKQAHAHLAAILRREADIAQARIQGEHHDDDFFQGR